MIYSPAPEAAALEAVAPVVRDCSRIERSASARRRMRCSSGDTTHTDGAEFAIECVFSNSSVEDAEAAAAASVDRIASVEDAEAAAAAARGVEAELPAPTEDVFKED